MISLWKLEKKIKRRNKFIWGIYKNKEERKESKLLPKISMVSMRYRDSTCCLHCIVIGDLDLLTMLIEFIMPSSFDYLRGWR